MAKREYSFYPGCSSQKGASSSNYLISVQTMCEELDIQLNEIPDWNCRAASRGQFRGVELGQQVFLPSNRTLMCLDSGLARTGHLQGAVQPDLVDSIIMQAGLFLHLRASH